jgi:hypothetical protein
VITTDKTVIWVAESESKGKHYLAIFNISPETQQLHYQWQKLGLEKKRYAVRDLWAHKDFKPADSIRITLPSHGCLLYSVDAR